MTNSIENEKPTRATTIEARNCSAYDIPISSNTSTATSTTTSEESSSSSVIDKDTIAARGIRPDVTRDEVSAEIQSFLDMPFSLHNEVRMFWTIVIFISILPAPTTVDLHPGFLMKGMVYFPLVGTLVGLAVATVFDLSQVTLQLPPVIAAATSTATGWYLTGCLHEDGLSDSADGIGGGWTRAQIFKIMTDSRVGTYGCAVLALYITTKIQLLAALGGSDWNLPDSMDLVNNHASRGAGPALIAAHTLARVTAPYLIRSFDYVDDEQGPKSSFYAFMIQAKHLVSLPRALTAMAFGFGVAAVLYGPAIAAGLLVLTLTFAQLAGNYGKAKLGGVMGDFLGATICVCELLILGMLLVVQQEQQSTLLWLWQTISDSANASGLELEKLQIMMQDKRVVAFLRFLVGYGFLKAWSIVVNYSNGKAQSSATASSNGVVETSKPSNETATVTEATPKSEAARILSLPTSTFRERYEAVQTYLDVLAKPVGSLGTLETWAARLAALQRTLQPNAQHVACLIFAGDHGAAASAEEGGEGCSAYPQAVTRSILVGLERGVAGASVLARANNVKLRTIDVGVILGADDPFKDGKNVISSPKKLPKGTRNFCVEPAMSAEECQQCIQIGRESLVQCVEETSATVVVLGEIGIGNTTSSSALITALTQKSTEDLCGGGAFATRELSESVVSKKIDIVKRALAHHYKESNSIQAADALAKLGGAEIAAIVGALMEASGRDIAVLVDGFIATAAALVAVCISPNVCHVLFFTSHSAEPGQRAAIEKIKAIAENNNIPVDKSPALSMYLRMGEGTAALLAVPILRSSAEVLSDMATIQDILS